MELVGLVVFGLFVLLGAFYMLDRPGWHATGKRISTYIRANIEGSKPIKQLEKKHEKVVEQNWDNQFKALDKNSVSGEKHEIIRTWFKNVSGVGIRPHFECKCGFKDWTTNDVNWAAHEAKKHVDEQNKAEKMMAESNGQFGWKI